MHRAKAYHPEEIGYELLQGSGVAEGELLGGCADVFIELFGTPLWPAPEEWRGKLLFLETSEEDMSPDTLTWLLRNLAARPAGAAHPVQSELRPCRPHRRLPHRPEIPAGRRAEDPDPAGAGHGIKKRARWIAAQNRKSGTRIRFGRRFSFVIAFTGRSAHRPARPP